MTHRTLVFVGLCCAALTGCVEEDIGPSPVACLDRMHFGPDASINGQLNACVSEALTACEVDHAESSCHGVVAKALTDKFDAIRPQMPRIPNPPTPVMSDDGQMVGAIVSPDSFRYFEYLRTADGHFSMTNPCENTPNLTEPSICQSYQALRGMSALYKAVRSGNVDISK